MPECFWNTCRVFYRRLLYQSVKGIFHQVLGQLQEALPTYCIPSHGCACVLPSCPTLYNPMDCSPPGCSVHGDFPDKNTGVGCHVLLEIFPTQGSNPGLVHSRQILYPLSHQGSPGILEWVAYPFSRDLLTQESNRGLLHGRQIIYQLNYQGSPSEAKLCSKELSAGGMGMTLGLLFLESHPRLLHGEGDW